MVDLDLSMASTLPVLSIDKQFIGQKLAAMLPNENALHPTLRVDMVLKSHRDILF